MPATNRRDFLRQLVSAGALTTGASWLSQLGFAQTRGTARVMIHQSRVRAELDRRVLGAFLEHLGRAIYEGVYDPKSKFADANGFRTDVIEEVGRMNVPIMRYPGGNFVSGYNWLDGVGPKDKRPTVLERAWNSLEPNQFGTNEFIDWCKLVKTEPLLGTNFGTASAESTVALMEYCNVEKGTKWSDLRREHGYAQPHNVKYWCLGNEMDGPWQIGHMPAREYGRKARDAARQMRGIDPTTQLIACGSSNTTMSTYMVWDREVLEECYDQVDAISLHCYYGNTQQQTGGDAQRYVGMNLDMERQIQEIAAVCDYVQALQNSPKRLWLSFDEWNVWYRARSGRFANGNRTFAPHLLEEVYNLEDALLVGGFVNTLIRQAERVRLGCLAQIVNVIAPLMTNADKVLRQSIYYPYAWSLQYAHGNVLDVLVESDTYEAKPPIGGTGGPPHAHSPKVPYRDVVATMNPSNGQVALFMLNRDINAEREVTIDWRETAPTRVLACQTLTGSDLKAHNTFEQPNTVQPQTLDAPSPGAKMTFKLPARSYTVAHLATS
jgi:alpha-N-arabinofuranosidase